LILLAVMLATGASPRASASPKRIVHLFYDKAFDGARGAPQCADAASLRRMVARQLGYDPFIEGVEEGIAGGDKALSLMVSVRPAGAGLVARVEMHDGETGASGFRELNFPGRDCASLMATLSLVMAIAIDPAALTRPAAPAEPDASPTSAPPAPPPVPAFAPEPASSATEPAPHVAPSFHRFRPQLGAKTLVGLGMGPTALYGVALELGFRSGRWSLSAGLRDYLPGVGHAVGGELRTGFFAGTLSPCVHERWFSGCAQVLVGGQYAESAGFLHNTSALGPLVGVGASVALAVPLYDALELEIGGELLATVVSSPLVAAIWTVDLSNSLVLMRVYPVFGDVFVSLRARFR
jgi:hypothetical protein